MWIYYSLIIFLLILAVLVFFMSQTLAARKLYLFLAFIPLFVLSAFRAGNVGNDTSAYLQLFESIKSYDLFTQYDTQFEFGYILFNKIIAFFFDNNQMLLIAAAIIIIPSILWFVFKESSTVWLSVYLFIVFRYYYFTMSGVRQSIALAIILLSIKYIEERKIFHFLTVVLIASSFHNSAIIFSIAYFIPFFKFDIKNVIIVLICLVIANALFEQVMNAAFVLFPQYQVYENSAYFETEGKFGIAFMSIIAFFVLILGIFSRYYNHVRIIQGRIFKDGNFYSFLMLFAFCISILALNANIIQRVQMYFGFFYILYIPNALSSIKEKNLRRLLTLVTMMVMLISHVVIYTFRPEWNTVAPYDFFWE